MINLKKINFQKSYEYFYKNPDVYKPSDCHTKSYVKFYDVKYDEVDSRSDDFYFVTGLMTFDDGIKKFCVVHSWVEDNGKVVDTTSLANSQLSNGDFNKKNVLEVQKILEDKISYIKYFSISNNDLTKKSQELLISNEYNKEKTFKAIEEYLIAIAQSVENDKEFIQKVKSEYGFELKSGNFQLEIF